MVFVKPPSYPCTGHYQLLVFPGGSVPTQSDIGEWWRLKLNEFMIKADMEEKRLAEENGDYHQGVPVITVIVAGGWSKGLHKHSYNVKSG